MKNDPFRGNLAIIAFIVLLIDFSSIFVIKLLAEFETCVFAVGLCVVIDV